MLLARAELERPTGRVEGLRVELGHDAVAVAIGDDKVTTVRGVGDHVEVRRARVYAQRQQLSGRGIHQADLPVVTADHGEALPVRHEDRRCIEERLIVRDVGHLAGVHVDEPRVLVTPDQHGVARRTELKPQIRQTRRPDELMSQTTCAIEVPGDQ